MSAGPYQDRSRPARDQDYRDDDGYEFDFHRGWHQQQQKQQQMPHHGSGHVIEEVDESEKVAIPHGTSYAMTGGLEDNEDDDGVRYTTFGPVAPGGESRREAQLRQVLASALDVQINRLGEIQVASKAKLTNLGN